MMLLRLQYIALVVAVVGGGGGAVVSVAFGVAAFENFGRP